MPQFAISTLTISNNAFVDPDAPQQYNDDTHSNRGVLAFAEALRGHKTITSLDISENNLGCKGQSGLVALAGAVCEGRIVTLDVSNNAILGVKGVRYDAIKAISHGISTPSGTRLEDLRIANNNLHATAVCFLGIKLVDTTLRHLDISENSIGVDSLERRSAAGMKVRQTSGGARSD